MAGRCREGDRATAEDAGIRVGGVDRAGLVPEVDHPEVCVEHAVQHVQDVVARDAEQRIDAFSF